MRGSGGRKVKKLRRKISQTILTSFMTSSQHDPKNNLTLLYREITLKQSLGARLPQPLELAIEYPTEARDHS